MAKGQKTGGRQKGTPNKTTSAVKTALSQAFDEMGGVATLKVWGEANKTEFYKLWTKMLPTEVKADVALGLEDLLDAISPGGPEESEG